MSDKRNPQDHKIVSTHAPSPDEIKARNRRNLAIALSLVAFAIVVFIITLINLKQGIMERPL